MTMGLIGIIHSMVIQVVEITQRGGSMQELQIAADALKQLVATALFGAVCFGLLLTGIGLILRIGGRK